MAAAAFSDDAFNKKLQEGQGPGTLIGNWYEECVLRDACGEGRSVPQRHIPRSGLLKDFTKVPSSGPRKQDDTFERIYGPPQRATHVPMSRHVGAGEEDLTGEHPIPDRLQAQGRVTREGPKSVLLKQARLDVAEQEVLDEEAIRAELDNKRYFDTTTGTVHAKPDEALAEKPVHLRKGFMDELMHGSKPDRMHGLGNDGLDHPTHVHYSNVEGVSHARMSLVDSRMRNDMKVSACSGFRPFGKSSEFSKPVGEFVRGLCKDEELVTYFEDLKGTQPVKNSSGTRPQASQFQHVPSLAALKEQIQMRVAEVWGPHGYVLLRQKLFDLSDHEGFVAVGSAVQVFRDELGCSTEVVPERMLQVYLEQLCTMRKGWLRVGALLSSLRPSPTQREKRRVLEAFRALGPVDGAVLLSSWLDRVEDPELKRIITVAFGGSESDGLSTDAPITEPVFMELFADLAPLADVDRLLVS